MGDEGRLLFDPALIARRRLRRWAALAVAVLVALHVAAEVTPFLRRPDLVLLDFWQSLRATRSPSSQVAIVGVDEKSIARFGPLAWPRHQYAPLVERLSAAGARVIGFDFTFGELERDAEGNRRLAEAMTKAGNVVFGYEFTRVGDPTPPAGPPSEAVRAAALARFASVAIPPAPSLIEPEPVIARAAAAVGHVRAIMSEDGRMRLLPLVIQHGDQAYPSLALQVARVYTGTPAQQVELSDGVLRMGEWHIPVSPAGEMLLDWPAAGEKAFAQYSFLDVVRGDVADEAFRGKAVLVAGTADGLDDRDFPFAVEAPGVLASAIFLDNVFRFSFVQAPAWAWALEWGLFLLLCGLCVWGLPRLATPLLLVGVPAAALLVLGGAGFLFVQKGVWVRAFFPALVLVAQLALVVTARLAASEKETRDAGAEKIESQRLLGLSFQEKGMLDMALATFNKLPFSEDMKLVYLNLGLDYENRGLRDKAYLVYKMIFDVDPRFEDVARRIERLGQAGTSFSVFAAPATPSIGSAPTARPVAIETQMQATERGLDADPALRGTLVNAPTEQMQAPGAGTASPALTSRTPAPGVNGLPSGPAPPGARLGRYEVERHLGRGGMGDVYLVRDTVIQRRVALKTIRVDANADPAQSIEIRQRFYREGQTAGQLSHPNIVTVYDVAEDLGMSYIVMEYVEGQTLTQWTRKQRLTLPQIKHVIRSVALALGYAHQGGIFHRDVKPDNIMLTKSGLVKVMDFGIARVVESHLTKTGSVMGTPAYMSPEQASGHRIDARSDIFSLGVILYELLTGRKPFEGETFPALLFAILKQDPPPPSQTDPSIPPAWDEIVARALAKDRDQRYATAEELARAIEQAPLR